MDTHVNTRGIFIYVMTCLRTTRSTCFKIYFWFTTMLQFPLLHKYKHCCPTFLSQIEDCWAEHFTFSCQLFVSFPVCQGRKEATRPANLWLVLTDWVIGSFNKYILNNNNNNLLFKLKKIWHWHLDSGKQNDRVTSERFRDAAKGDCGGKH